MDGESRRYSSIWQLRVDVWSSIADLAQRLSDPTQPPDGRAGREHELTELLELVARVERYWAHPGPGPGPGPVSTLRELVAARDYEPALRAAIGRAGQHARVTIPGPGLARACHRTPLRATQRCRILLGSLLSRERSVS
jgi:hypothetical protein